MADAREEQIMQAIKTACTGLATTGANVFRGRAYPLGESQLPGLLVYMGPDTAQLALLNSYVDWNLLVGVEAYVRSGSAVVDTLLSTIRKEVHAAIMATPQLGLSFVIDTQATLAAEPVIDGEGNQPIARRRLEFLVIYRASRTDISA